MLAGEPSTALTQNVFLFSNGHASQIIHVTDHLHFMTPSELHAISGSHCFLSFLFSQHVALLVWRPPSGGSSPALETQSWCWFSNERKNVQAKCRLLLTILREQQQKLELKLWKWETPSGFSDHKALVVSLMYEQQNFKLSEGNWLRQAEKRGGQLAQSRNYHVLSITS